MKHNIVLQIPKEKITLLVKIMEGYDHLAVVSTVDSSKGIVRVRATPDTEAEARKIISQLNFVEKIID